MAGFCPQCGKDLAAGGQCSRGHGRSDVVEPSGASALTATGSTLPARDIGRLPKADTGRRLLGSGIEFVAYVVFKWLIAVLDTFSGGVLGFLSLLLVGLIVLRDFKAGTFSIAKRVSQMRVVDWKTGRSASNVQALVRNSYYLALPLAAAFLPAFLPVGDWPLFLLFVSFVVLDTAMILASPQGRRLGDMLAGTQVIETRT